MIIVDGRARPLLLRLQHLLQFQQQLPGTWGVRPPSASDELDRNDGPGRPFTERQPPLAPIPITRVPSPLPRRALERRGLVLDGVDSPTIDRADPAESIADEGNPSGARANQGSYGQTVEASLSVLPCPTTVFVRQAGDGDVTTIQSGINILPNPLTGHSCNHHRRQRRLQRAGHGAELINSGSSITIALDSTLTVHPLVRSGFVIRNASVNVVKHRRRAPTVGVNYGILASSANISISSVIVSDPGGLIALAGIALSSYSSLSYSSITVLNAAWTAPRRQRRGRFLQHGGDREHDRLRALRHRHRHQRRDRKLFRNSAGHGASLTRAPSATRSA